MEGKCQVMVAKYQPEFTAQIISVASSGIDHALAIADKQTDLWFQDQQTQPCNTPNTKDTLLNLFSVVWHEWQYDAAQYTPYSNCEILIRIVVARLKRPYSFMKSFRLSQQIHLDYV
jgi:hypothetical protein